MCWMHQRVLLICGPRGIGKSYLTHHLLETGRYGQPLKTTTRPMRPGEVDGVDYEFLSPDDYAAAAAAGAFFMDNEIQGYRYAIRRSALEDVWAEGKICVLQIYYTVMHQFLAAYPYSYAIYLKPANPAILEERLRQRCPDEAALRRELADAERELAAIGPFERLYRAIVPVNDDQVSPLVELIEEALALPKSEIPQR